MQFEWDETKAASNLDKHGVSFEEAVTVFNDPGVLPAHDDAHGEARMTLIGFSATARMLFVVVVEREADLIRVISARPATKPERKRYAQAR